MLLGDDERQWRLPEEPSPIHIDELFVVDIRSLGAVEILAY